MPLLLTICALSLLLGLTFLEFIMPTPTCLGLKGLVVVVSCSRILDYL
jgi:hypothetical protein